MSMMMPTKIRPAATFLALLLVAIVLSAWLAQDATVDILVGRATDLVR